MGQTHNQIDWNAESRRFDDVPDLYDAYRPGYPDELVNTIVTETGLQPGHHILEIGSGSGKATAAFVGQGYHILCIEPGANLAGLAARKFKDLPEVHFEQSRFENWQSQGRLFDLVISAQAFHWVPEDVGYANVAAVLKSGGHMALFWNMYPYIDSPLRRALDQVYLRCAPEIAAKNTDIEINIRRIADAIQGSGHFQALQIRRFPWFKVFTTQSYLGLLGTFSDHLRLDEEHRQRLFAGIAAVIEANGGQIRHNYLAVLYLSQKQSL